MSDENSDVYDPLVRLLRAREGAARRSRARVRRGRAGRRPGLPGDAERADRRLDGPADRDRRPADRGLHGALAPRSRRHARRTARRVAAEPLARRAVPRAATGDADLVDRRAAPLAGLAAAP